ncbi:MAG: PepSY-associated TM helix domain-containing protein [Sphingobium sp.]|uniref:PepSY-associated TM helix domain-containing protein n=1 Tax=Sphingobium sp. TaxID=1912891 RepID=UPI0029A97448|nr:PepSY-associated TM helix domain-containing protein [Sphingobium sp.]MDX3911705.1 PepSY-associated TM helix domain-containing protein [Sphingobium sp.]
MSASVVAVSAMGLRQSMAWLHTWVGLWFCWLLYAVFLTGTLAVFEEPVTHWMTPEHHASEPAVAGTRPGPVDRERRLTLGAGFLARNAPDASYWEIWPADRNQDNALFSYWLDAEGAHVATQLDPETGKPAVVEVDL